MPAAGIFSLPFRDWCPLRVYSLPFRDWCPLRVYSLSPSAIGDAAPASARYLALGLDTDMYGARRTFGGESNSSVVKRRTKGGLRTVFILGSYFSASLKIQGES
eukprot:1189669-Prorocentrum_minimum.AAC.2